MLPGLILNSSLNLREAFSAALKSYYIFPSPFTLLHSLVTVSYFFLSLQIFIPPTPSLLLAYDYAYYFIEKKNDQGKKKQNIRPA